MKRLLLVFSIAVVAAVLTPPRVASQQTSDDPAARKALITQYCITCHNERAKTGGLMLDKLNLDTAATWTNDGETWEKVIRKVRTGMMPPAGARRPGRADLDAFAAGVEANLDRVALAKLN